MPGTNCTSLPPDDWSRTALLVSPQPCMDTCRRHAYDGSAVSHALCVFVGISCFIFRFGLCTDIFREVVRQTPCDCCGIKRVRWLRLKKKKGRKKFSLKKRCKTTKSPRKKKMDITKKIESKFSLLLALFYFSFPGGLDTVRQKRVEGQRLFNYKHSTKMANYTIMWSQSTHPKEESIQPITVLLPPPIFSSLVFLSPRCC